jgi:hypothetical protein
MDFAKLCAEFQTDKGRYASFYESLSEEWRTGVKKILEIGLAGGSSLRLWEDWFPSAKIYGIDEDLSRMRMFRKPEWILGSMRQEDSVSVRKFAEEHGPWDVIIDDAGHIPALSQSSFLILRPYTGIFIVEDVRDDQVSLWPKDAARHQFVGENILVFEEDHVNAFRKESQPESVS